MSGLRELTFWLRNHVRASLPAWKRTVPLERLRASLETRRLRALGARFDLSRCRVIGQAPRAAFP